MKSLARSSNADGSMRLQWRRLGLMYGGRAALFAAAIAPMSVWPLSGATLVHPWHALAWALCCAVAASTFLGRGAKISFWMQAGTLPLSLGWMGSVAVTGYGPSNAALSALDAGAVFELAAALGLALARPAFLVAATLSILALAWAWVVLPRASEKSQNAMGILFLCALLPAAAVNMNGTAYQPLSGIAVSEVRNTVVWFSHIGMAKEALSQALDVLARGSSGLPAVRSTKFVERSFQAKDGLAIFIVGDSLRADALIVEGRGPWSTALAARLNKGLGMRLADACAGGNATYTSIPRLLTAVDPSDSLGAAQMPTILALAKAGGAKTAYIMNHESWVVPESGHDLIQKTSSMEHTVLDDEVMVALSDFVQRIGKGPKAVILHLYGQHFNYHDRYPDKFFAEEPPNMSSENLEGLRYARSAEYGLKVLLDAADILDQQVEPAFLIFTSDHGENLPTDRTGKRYHAGPVSGLNDTMVPVLVLWNRAFADGGRQRLLKKLIEQPMIAHRDVAKAWLVLEGLPGNVEPTIRPVTWGSLAAGIASGSLDCRELRP